MVKKADEWTAREEYLRTAEVVSVEPLQGSRNVKGAPTPMNKRFRDMVDALPSKYESLAAMDPIRADEVPKDTPVGGVYLFSEGATHLYVGRTKRRIAVRARNHFSAAPDCPFAWLLAREATGKKATYRPDGSRKALLADANFTVEYGRAKQRIRAMNVRYVHEPDPTRQALLEIYVAVATAARHNDSDTH
jgi:hypothetical protein